VAPIKFDEEQYSEVLNNKSLTIAYFDSMPSLPTSNAVKRSIQLVKTKMEAQGHKFVEFKLDGLDWDAIKNYFGIFGAHLLGPMSKLFEEKNERPHELY
jgi:hypothetical protein